MSQQLDLRSLFLLLFLVFGLHSGLEAKKKAEPKDEPKKSKIEQGLETWEKRDGFLTHYLDSKEGRVFLEIPAGDTGEILMDLLWVESLRSGLGSNPVGLDRGQLGPTRWLQIREVGGKILFELPNLSYRADTENPQERAAVRDSFAKSVIWAAPIEHRFKDGRRLIDLSPFLLRDAHGVVRRLKQTNQGSFSLSSDSVVDLDAALSFPKNTEFEAWLTFQSDEPGREVDRPSSADLQLHEP